MRTTLYLIVLLACAAQAADEPGRQPHAGNPILPGYYADPSLVQYAGRFYLYATLDPWGDRTLGCWESADFSHWTYRSLNWPTKEACKSPTSGNAGVWAASVVRAKNGKFFMYVSVGNEVWAGVAEHPLGPWNNALGQQPLIHGKFKPGYHMIDAEAFVDEDGTGWLYWGSGWNWKNGKCWAVRLAPDMTTFDGEVHDVTPSTYFEGPFMVKRGGRYFLMYSTGVTTKDDYQVHYAIGDTPLGPFTEPANSPILVTDRAKHVISPGHHAVFRHEGRDYILYHRHSIPFDPEFVGRQVCVDELRFTADGLIEKVEATHEGPTFVSRRESGLPATATASSGNAQYAVDDNYATRWGPVKGCWLQLDLGTVKSFSRLEIRFEYAWKPSRFAVEVSEDGSHWKTWAEQTSAGSPVVIEQRGNARHLRLVSGDTISVWEWVVMP